VIPTIFLGTPAASIPSLRALSSLTDLRLIITRPDKPQGRSGRVRPSPVKEAATELGIPVAQPSRPDELYEALTDAAPLAVGVVVAFGMILSPEALRVPKRGFINVHFSLLPRWRGAAPVERAILAGDEVTGVTLMVMDQGLDTGPVVASQKTAIDQAETAGELAIRLADLGARLLVEHLIDYWEGRTVLRPQPSNGTIYAGRITTDEAFLTPTSSSTELLRAVRAYSPRPGARLADRALKVWKAAPTELGAVAPGQLRFDGRRLYLGTADHPIELVEVQPSGGRRMSGAAWARGRQGELGRPV
jgi:methionyl-tRNA formyltransferase